MDLKHDDVPFPDGGTSFCGFIDGPLKKTPANKMRKRRSRDAGIPHVSCLSRNGARRPRLWICCTATTTPPNAIPRTAEDARIFASDGESCRAQ